MINKIFESKPEGLARARPISGKNLVLKAIHGNKESKKEERERERKKVCVNNGQLCMRSHHHMGRKQAAFTKIQCYLRYFSSFLSRL